MRGCNVLILKAAKGILFILLLFFAAHTAFAADGDIVLTITDELGSSLPETMFNFACEGGTTKSIVDGGVDDDDATADGTITILASVAQNEPDCSSGESFIVNEVEKDGYVTTGSSLTTYSTSTANVASPSLQFAFKVTILTVDNIPAYGATTTAEKGFKTTCIEDGTTGVYYCPVPLANKNKNVKFQKDYFDTQIEQFPSDRTSATDPQVITTISDVIYTVVSGVTIANSEQGSSFKRIGWTTTTDPNFKQYEIYGKPSHPGVHYDNFVLRLPVTDISVGSVVVPASGSAEPNYYVVYVVDADDNRSFISSEVKAYTGAGSVYHYPAVAFVARAVVSEEAVVISSSSQEQIVEEITVEEIPEETVEEETAEEVLETQPPFEEEIAEEITEEIVEEISPVQEIETSPEIVTTEETSEEVPIVDTKKEALEEIRIPERRVVPPAVPRRNEPRTSLLPSVLNVIPETIAKVQSNLQASFQIVKERFSERMHLGSAFQENTGLLIEIFRSFLGFDR